MGLVTAVGTVIAAIACGGDKPGVSCDNIVIPGIIITPPGIQVALRTNQGQPAALGASLTAVATDGSPQSGYVADSLTLDANVSAGTYSVRITKPGYRDTTIANVVVRLGQCNHVETTKLSVVLQPLSGAAAVRSVGVAGAEFLASPGSRATLVALVDADSGISRAVAWHVSDTTMASIDQHGVVTAKCSSHGGTERATATSVANGAVSGSVTFGIGASGSC